LRRGGPMARSREAMREILRGFDRPKHPDIARRIGAEQQ
jgi:hypothetical protein